MVKETKHTHEVIARIRAGGTSDERLQRYVDNRHASMASAYEFELKLIAQGFRDERDTYKAARDALAIQHAQAMQALVAMTEERNHARIDARQETEESARLRSLLDAARAQLATMTDASNSQAALIARLTEERDAAHNRHIRAATDACAIAHERDVLVAALLAIAWPSFGVTPYAKRVRFLMDIADGALAKVTK
jgi:hypothetical protein